MYKHATTREGKIARFGHRRLFVSYQQMTEKKLLLLPPLSFVMWGHHIVHSQSLIHLHYFQYSYHCPRRHPNHHPRVHQTGNQYVVVLSLTSHVVLLSLEI